MTYNELCEEVKALGFETTVDSPARLFSAARRALREIHTARPIFSNAVIFQRVPKPIRYVKEILHRGDGEISIPYYSARSFSCKASGEGIVKIKENGDEKILSFNGTYSVIREFLHGDGELVFTGDFSFTITSLAFYGEITSASTEDIPVFGIPGEYDMTKLVSGFITLAGPPADSSGNAIAGAQLSGNILTLPSDYSGDVYMICKRGSDLTEDGQIEIQKECEPLLALLTAAYFWLDDDPEKSQYYHSLYREGMNALRYSNRSRVDRMISTGNGWA